ncbi:MAG: NAD(P)/FAD-dependent oxidoreductase [Prevotellaceae bacterium]|jgi:uncharacterized FAD-dependent dehydrogenase|nr:NAD(P)/FAD-dependent oxidoreductase [Prevotellaceae bacterium]
MPVKIDLTLTPEQAFHQDKIRTYAAAKARLTPDKITDIRIIRKSIDARSGFPKVNLSVELLLKGEHSSPKTVTFNPRDVTGAKPAIIIGAGPAGLFAALRLIELGLKPIVLERGKNMHERKKDIAQLNRNISIDPNSNYCFGEGGAGTFSDGKLYTRSRKKGDVQRIYAIFHHHGADESVLYESHPHVGSDKLPPVIENITKTIIEHGGEIHFNKRVAGLMIEKNAIKGCSTEDGETYFADALLLASGHSASDIYELLHDHSIALEPKGFAMGVRVEHPQALIDKIQYNMPSRGQYLPAATYSLVEQVDGRGVYTFCMCPGGHIVPAGNADNRIVVNGMSVSKRNSAFANAGIVVEIRPEDIPAEFQQYGDLAGLKFQQHVEELAGKNNGGKKHVAPAQRLTDFVEGRLSVDLPETSYLPGVISSPVHFWLPDFIGQRIQKALRLFDRKMHGFLTHEAIVIGVESRSSSPVRIPRDKDSMQHPAIRGLYPCGEGSGYSGGITSSAIDGENAAQKAADFLNRI